MSQAALTARYRPQTFAEVAGQETIKTILSRASLEGMVAPAYLFSGTRGVGKTTLARIFAKALNCRKAPTAEPCNQCDQCRAITMGGAVDVVEIDGASNRGIDDVRRLKEVVGYAAMEGGYKIFIIDEAHMLSREAFNALLKTLEEPPARVVFIMATTEPHKFPATIISRCQHYVFKRLPENGLQEHLEKVLRSEGADYEENALRLIAKRGAGSVRDSMSLLGQVLALGEAKLTEESARKVLGLAGQESFMQMLQAVKNGDAVSLSGLLSELLDQGLDMGFFLRELAGLWRNLFMLRQAGEAALPVVELPEKEARACLEAAQEFSLQHIHACWQMTLEGQRRVLSSLEPALALELLLLNIAMLPRLLPLEGGAGQALKTPSPAPAAGQTGPASPPADGGATPTGSTQGKSGLGAESQSSAPHARSAAPEPPGMEQRQEEAASEGAFPDPFSPSQEDVQEPSSYSPAERQPADAGWPEEHGPGQAAWEDGEFLASADQFAPYEACDAPEDRPSESAGPAAAVNEASAPNEQEKRPLPDWESVLALCEQKQKPARLLQLLRRATASLEGDRQILTARDAFSAEHLGSDEMRALLSELFSELCGRVPEIVVLEPEVKRKSREDLKQEVLNHPLVREVENMLGARPIDYGQLF